MPIEKLLRKNSVVGGFDVDGWLKGLERWWVEKDGDKVGVAFGINGWEGLEDLLNGVEWWEENVEMMGLDECWCKHGYVGNVEVEVCEGGVDRLWFYGKYDDVVGLLGDIGVKKDEDGLFVGSGIRFYEWGWSVNGVALGRKENDDGVYLMMEPGRWSWSGLWLLESNMIGFVRDGMLVIRFAGNVDVMIRKMFSVVLLLRGVNKAEKEWLWEDIGVFLGVSEECL